jgi:hypothetical protein
MLSENGNAHPSGIERRIAATDRDQGIDSAAISANSREKLTRSEVSRKIEFKKQYKPIGFGDRPDPGTVEGHRNAMDEAAETRRYNMRMKELEAHDADRKRTRAAD